ncbi:hypothetical protein [Streptacidiphilus rugosus]|uniref:hypothetical protein n=1 Tax=Streptacidiphilus rugosus TaxID=405783 RepID=UPI000A4433B6|nr:hypothetical protein [Streptacidiphilus rugosus]
MTWQDAAYNHGWSSSSFLTENPYNNSLHLGEVDVHYSYWTDTAHSDGGYTEVNEGSGNCLDSNYSGQAYTHNCLSGDMYQRWYEISTNSGWCLWDLQTGKVLDANPTVYTNTNYGDGDSYQRWE